MPMNIIFLYILTRFFRAQSWNLATFGIFGIREGKQKNHMSIYENPALIPFAWNFFINMLLIILFANIDVSLPILSESVTIDQFKSCQHLGHLLLDLRGIDRRLSIGKAWPRRQISGSHCHLAQLNLHVTQPSPVPQ